MREVFIALEGGEGAGKTTQTRMLTQRLNGEGMRVITIHEPGSTPLGDHLRTYLKSEARVCPEAELMLFQASRAELVREIILPSLNKGISIVADRFTASSIAYQGYGRGLDLGTVEKLNNFATGGIQPDLNILLDLPPQEGLARTTGTRPGAPDDPQERTRQDPQGTRRFEELPLRFHQRVRKGYIAQARANEERWAVVDAGQKEEQVSQDIWERVKRLLEERD